jgi:flagellar FliL protein
MPRALITLLCLLAPLSLSPAWAAGGGGGGFAAPGYLAFDPPFVVNLLDRRTRFMQIVVTGYVETEEAAEALRYHMPVLRHALIMQFSGKSVEEATSVETREQWRAEALKEIRRIMTELTGDPAVSELYFSDFIIQ